MTRWIRVPADTLCGFCYHRIIKQGEPARLMKLPGVKRERVRCVDCVGPAPPDLPPFTPVTPIQQRTKKMKPLASIAKQWMPYRDGDDAA